MIKKMLIDTYAHLYWESFKQDFAAVIQRSKEAGVELIVNVGVDVEKSRIAAELENNQIKFYSTIGIHPHEVLRLVSLAQDKHTNINLQIQQEMQKLEEIYHKNPKKIIGVGECGLDFFFESNPDWTAEKLTVDEIKDLQRKLFQAQIDLAKKLDLPLLVHCRDDRSKNPNNVECWNECLEMVRGWKGILHCYSGTETITNHILSKSELDNFLVSFAGNITYPKNEYLRKAIRSFPLEKIVLETDCPFLAPQSKRGQRNEPSSVRDIAELIAEIKEASFEEVAKFTTTNVTRLFKLVLE
ncbi:TatD family hydrolase [Candidatus Daviesbacteria bacterium]|nr:TatD family hydrolase [Candidatus Daviesbacteria bacterium]